MDEKHKRVVIDTNIWVAAAFNPNSASAKLLEAVREGSTALIWDRNTQQETRAILEQIPPLNWSDFEELFREENRFDGPTHPDQFPGVADEDDRKFAALADAAGAVLISNDQHLLSVRANLGILVLTPDEWVRQTSRSDREET